MQYETCDLPIDAVVHLVNEWGTAPRQVADEEGDPYPPVGSLLAFTDRSPRSWRGLSTPELQEIADDLHRVFAADRMAVRASVLSNLISRYDLRARAEERDSALRVVLVGAGDSQTLAAAALTSVLAFLMSPTTGRGAGGRMGICGADRCVDVWVDSSCRRPRKYCSETCSVRTRVAAHRHRHA